MPRPHGAIVATTQEHGQELRRLIDEWVLQHESIIAQMLPPRSDSHELVAEDKDWVRPTSSQVLDDKENVVSKPFRDDQECAPGPCKELSYSGVMTFRSSELFEHVDRSSSAPDVDVKIQTGIGASFHALKGARVIATIKGLKNSSSRENCVSESLLGGALLRTADRQRRRAARRSHIDLGGLSFQEEPSRLQQVIDHPIFELVGALAVLSNSVFVGFQVEYGAAELTYTLPTRFHVINTVYTLLFLAELLVRIWAHRLRFFKFVDMWIWNYLDIFIVSTAVFELCVDTMAAKEQSKRQTSNLRIVRILRVVRFLRVIRVAKVLRFIHALRIFLYSIVATMQALIWALILLLGILYVFGIIFTQTVGDHFTNQYDGNGRDFNKPFAERDTLRLYWGGLGRSMFTLFKSISGGVSWHECVFPLYTLGWFWIAAFIFYLSFTYFAVLNVVTGIFCQSAIDTAQNNAELLVQDQMTLRDAYIHRIQMVFEKIDMDHSGTLTLDELEENLERPEVMATLGSLNVDSIDAWALFKLLDTDMTNEITLEEFVTGLMKIKGTVRRTDILELQVQVTGVVRGLERLWQEILKKRSPPMKRQPDTPKRQQTLLEEVSAELVHL